MLYVDAIPLISTLCLSQFHCHTYMARELEELGKLEGEAAEKDVVFASCWLRVVMASRRHDI